MSTNPDQLKILQEALANKKLIFVFGTGISNALTDGIHSTFSWAGLIDTAFAELVSLEKVSPEQAESYTNFSKSQDIDDVLSATEFISRKFGAPEGALWARWLETIFGNIKATNIQLVKSLQHLKKAGALFATLNYDTLIDKSLSAAPVTADDVRGVREWMNGEQSIFHLHGVWSKPPTCVFGIRDYEKIGNDEVRDTIQRTLITYSTVVFVGCGATFEDPNFRKMADWLKIKLKGQGGRHYILVKKSEYSGRKADAALHGFVDPIIYGENHNELSLYLQQISIQRNKTRSFKKIANQKTNSFEYEEVLAKYRNFLLKDCGQMTIEGLRADMDTAQRKFDIEKLFVPLTVAKIPPTWPERDKEREKKLLEWQEGEGAPKAFGVAMGTSARIALLALPGGGKTLLLKRIAVAYADSVRHDAACDKLPKEELVPILIRCREWRTEIRKPILKIIESIPDQAGEINLNNFNKLVAGAISKNTLLLLVDGLDEIHDDADRIVFVDNLEKFITANSRIKLIVTSREAGFDLVAPSLSRFCERYRISPLSGQSITDLCMHWHKLMGEDINLATKENENLIEQLFRNNALRRLAENPLLLTMLLVVKHGAGRLPPDRVSLYERAVEVLVDTWNIKGHAPLGLKEAVPQLACIAYELMKKGVQTATRSELIKILESARSALPQLGRYSRDTPNEFLQRVEIRSSLLLEGGRIAQGVSSVPFYQFRHLTFQEYLAAYAAAEGVFIGYKSGDDIMVPLEPYALTTEWKEVIPMAAVIARKQANPLTKFLLSEAQALLDAWKEGKNIEGLNNANLSIDELPFAVRQLIRCIVEEAEFAPEDVIPALRVIAFFARGCRSKDDWQALAEGPYGIDLLKQAVSIYKEDKIPNYAWTRNTCCAFAALIKGINFWKTPVGDQEVIDLLKSQKSENIFNGLMVIMGVFWLDRNKHEKRSQWFDRVDFQVWFDNSDIFIAELAIWAWAIQISGVNGFEKPRARRVLVTQTEANSLVKNYFRMVNHSQIGIIDFAINVLLREPRGTYQIDIDNTQKNIITRKLNITKSRDVENRRDGTSAAWVIGYLSYSITNEKLKKTFSYFQNHELRREKDLSNVMKELGIKESIENKN